MNKKLSKKRRNKDGKRYYPVKTDPDLLDKRAAQRASCDQVVWNKAIKAYGDLVKRDAERGFTSVSFGYPFEILTFDEYIAIVQLNCYYCDREKSSGVDRRDSNLGHWLSNVVPCCETCNIILNTLPPDVKDNLKDGLRKSFQSGLLSDWLPPYKRGKKQWK